MKKKKINFEYNKDRFCYESFNLIILTVHRSEWLTPLLVKF